LQQAGILRIFGYMQLTEKPYCVVTTVQSPTDCMRDLAAQWPGAEASLLIVGDRKGPFAYSLPKSRLIDIEQQRALPWALARILPEKHYARKNLGYLEAMAEGATLIYETDDDNAPATCWELRDADVSAHDLSAKGWLNVYACFTKERIWPRGLPLGDILRPVPEPSPMARVAKAPIQQGLADGSPDVDAIWRLVLDQDFSFDAGASVRLGRGCWCPFNSQTTWWRREAYALLYLPSFCPFRMTDIWRSFVAQRCLWELGFKLVFHGAEVKQLRNPHDPMLDFRDEVPGYLDNARIAECLGALELQAGPEHVGSNLMRCYQELVHKGILPEVELALLDAWLTDLRTLGIC
jgi:hypothetical protein